MNYSFAGRRINNITVGCMLLSILIALTMLAPAHAEDIFMKRSWSHAVGGYDVVAYHTQSEAVVGNDAYQTELHGVTWRFSSQANLDLFLANPDQYRPHYGGYCAWAMASGKKAAGDPNVWHIYEGNLYLNVSPGIKRKWLKDIDGFIERADAQWAAL